MYPKSPKAPQTFLFYNESSSEMEDAVNYQSVVLHDGILHVMMQLHNAVCFVLFFQCFLL